MRFLAALGMTVRFYGKEGRSGDSNDNLVFEILFSMNRRFSLFNKILACHSERSEESPGLFTISLKVDYRCKVYPRGKMCIERTL
jgi:hypothetical protein